MISAKYKGVIGGLKVKYTVYRHKYWNKAVSGRVLKELYCAPNERSICLAWEKEYLLLCNFNCIQKGL